MKRLITLGVALLWAGPALAAGCGTNTIVVKDGNGVSQTFCRGVDAAANFISAVNLMDSTGVNVATVTAGNALKVDGSAVTQPISAASLPLPTGASTAAGLTTINTTLGSPFQAGGSIGNTSFIANAGANLNTSALALDTSVNGLLLSQGSTTSGQKGTLVYGAVTTSTPLYTTAQSDPLSMDVNGLLRVSIKDTPTNTNNLNVNLAASGLSNLSTNVAQFGGSNVATGTGAGGAGIPRVTISNDSSLAANQSVNTAQFGGTNISTGTGAGGAGIPRVTISNDSSLAANQSVNLSQINGQTAANGGVTGTLLVEQGCAGQTVANTTTTPINNAGSSSNLKLVTKASSKNVYICSLNLVAAAATNVALVDGTQTTNQCDTSTAGMAGGATAATGWNLAANGGLTIGNGQGVVFKSTGTNLDVCLLFSAGNQVSGSITWAQF